LAKSPAPTLVGQGRPWWRGQCGKDMGEEVGVEYKKLEKDIHPSLLPVSFTPV